jgi:hypothetical protein
MTYLILERDDFDIQRADLSFKIRGSVRFYNELVAPGIGAAWKVRDFSRAVAGLYLKQTVSTKSSAIAIANAIEALGNKLYWSVNNRVAPEGFRIRGKRAFARYQDDWRFSQLSQSKYYVQITQRQNITRALTAGYGLDFSQGSSRFNRMELSQSGQELALSFLNQTGAGSGSPKLSKNLTYWIQNSFDVSSYLEALQPKMGPMTPSHQEKEQVYRRLCSLLPPESPVVKNDGRRRLRLIEVLESIAKEQSEWNAIEELLKALESQGGVQHSNDIRTAISFENMREQALVLFAKLTENLSNFGDQIKLQEVLKNGKVLESLEVVRTCAKDFIEVSKFGNNSHLDARLFANDFLLTDARAIEALVKRDGRILSFGGDSIFAGAVFRPMSRDKSSTDNDDDYVPKAQPARLFQFIELWRDSSGEA